MTKEELKIFVDNTVNDFICRCRPLANSISQRDFNEVARPVATLAVLNGYSWLASSSNGFRSSVNMYAYLKALKLILRCSDLERKTMRDRIISNYKSIMATVRDNEALTTWELSDVIAELIEEAEQ